MIRSHYKDKFSLEWWHSSYKIFFKSLEVWMRNISDAVGAEDKNEAMCCVAELPQVGAWA